MVGERVKHARIYHGWTQVKLAELIGKTQAAIHKIEKTDSAAPETVAAIAEVSQFAPWFFDRGHLPDLPKGSLRFRKRLTAPVRDDERIRAHVRQAIEAISDLEERLPKNVHVPTVRLRPVPSDVSITDDFIEDLAVQCRELLGVGPEDPIPNLTRAIERAGVTIIGSSQEIEKHEGASYWPDFPKGRPIICVSRGRPGDRHRLCLAHELGHFLLHQLQEDRDTREMEAQAFRFAGALLLPREAAFEVIETPVVLRDLAMLKAKYGISIAALVRRSLDLGIITPVRRESLEKQISARGWRKSEPVRVNSEQPQLVRDIVRASTGTDHPWRLHSILGLPPLAIRDMLT